MPLENLQLSERINSLLSGAGYVTAGDLLLQSKLNSDAILALSGIGPKAMEEIESTLAGLTFPEPELELAEQEIAAAGAAEAIAGAELEAIEALEQTPAEAAPVELAGEALVVTAD